MRLLIGAREGKAASFSFYLHPRSLSLFPAVRLGLRAIPLYCLVMQILRRPDKRRRPSPRRSPPLPTVVVLRAARDGALLFRSGTHIRVHAHTCVRYDI